MEGEPVVTVEVPTEAPSRVKVTVPEGGVAPVPGGVMLAVSWTELPARGVVVDGVRVTVGADLETVIVSALEVEL